MSLLKEDDDDDDDDEGAWVIPRGIDPKWGVPEGRRDTEDGVLCSNQVLMTHSPQRKEEEEREESRRYIERLEKRLQRNEKKDRARQRRELRRKRVERRARERLEEERRRQERLDHGAGATWSDSDDEEEDSEESPEEREEEGIRGDQQIPLLRSADVPEEYFPVSNGMQTGELKGGEVPGDDLVRSGPHGVQRGILAGFCGRLLTCLSRARVLIESLLLGGRSSH